MGLASLAHSKGGGKGEPSVPSGGGKGEPKVPLNFIIITKNVSRNRWNSFSNDSFISK